MYIYIYAMRCRSVLDVVISHDFSWFLVNVTNHALIIWSPPWTLVPVVPVVPVVRHSPGATGQGWPSESHRSDQSDQSDLHLSRDVTWRHVVPALGAGRCPISCGCGWEVPWYSSQMFRLHTDDGCFMMLHSSSGVGRRLRPSSSLT